MNTGEIKLEDIVTPSEFEKQYPNLFDGEGTTTMETLIRQRGLNGLTDCGAVVEPAQRRPMVVKPRFLHWLLNRKKAAKAKKRAETR